jgi:hypothetical protein
MSPTCAKLRLMRPIVIIESPYAGDTVRNLRYARAAVRDSILRGEAPFGSHLLYTQEGVLHDEDPEERQLGIDVGFAFRQAAEMTAVYKDLGISAGMTLGIEHALEHGKRVEYRSLPEWAAEAERSLDTK